MTVATSTAIREPLIYATDTSIVGDKILAKKVLYVAARLMFRESRSMAL